MGFVSSKATKEDLQCFYSSNVLHRAANPCMMWIKLLFYSMQKQVIPHFPDFTTQFFPSFLLLFVSNTSSTSCLYLLFHHCSLLGLCKRFFLGLFCDKSVLFVFILTLPFTPAPLPAVSQCSIITLRPILVVPVFNRCYSVG